MAKPNRRIVRLTRGVAVLLAVGLGSCDLRAPRDEAGDVDEPGPPGPVRETTACVVTRITDGDSIECRPGGRVRLLGIDTPELSQGGIAHLARQALARMIPVGSEVELEPDVELRDRYGRVLAYVWVDGVLVNWVLVRQGWAVLLTYPPNVRYVEWLESAQRAARDEERGLWAIDGFDCLPVDYRAGRCR